MFADLAATLASRCSLSARAVMGERVRARGRIRVIGGDRILIGDDVDLDGRAAPIELHADTGGSIVLGAGVRVQGGVSIEAQLCVDVGQRTALHGFCKVLDNHFHNVLGDRHHGAPPSRPVFIGDDCEIGWRAIVLPGAWLGAGVCVLPGVVVSRHVPAGAVIGGSPPLVLESAEGG